MDKGNFGLFASWNPSTDFHKTWKLERIASSFPSILLAIFPGEPVLASFIEAKDDGNGGDNWSHKMSKAPVKLSPPSYQTQLIIGQMPFLSRSQQCQTAEWRKYHTPWTCSPQAHLASYGSLTWPLKAPGYLGGGCQAFHWSSDASNAIIAPNNYQIII